jgi:hypothetical protein
MYYLLKYFICSPIYISYTIYLPGYVRVWQADGCAR